MAAAKDITVQGELRIDEPMSKHTSWRVGGPADVFFVPADEVMKEARETARAMAEHDPEVLALAKQALNFGAAASMKDSMANEEKLSGVLRQLRASRDSRS